MLPIQNFGTGTPNLLKRVQLWEDKVSKIKLMTETDNLTPSLLESQSRGGDTAEGGSWFQESVILARIPVWLAQDGFTAMLREGIGDAEANFFIPGCGFSKEFLEVKNHTLKPSEFWNEIRRFQEVDAGSPDTYQSFILISAGISKELDPLVNGLRRVRDPDTFYEENSGVKEKSLKDYIQLVEKMCRTRQEALFIFEKVKIEADLSTAKSYGEALFKQSLTENLPEYEELSSKTLDDIYARLSTFIRQRKNLTITRQEIETKLRDRIPSSQLLSPRPIQIYTAIAPDDNPAHPGLRFDWTSFSGGETRAFAPPQQWNQQLLGELQETRSWIENHRNTKLIELAGNCRLSAFLAIGSVFSAVRGYVIKMEYRSELWSTNNHPSSKTPKYPLVHQTVREAGEHLVVSIGILKDIVSEVESNLERYKLTDMPLLHIQGERPITSPQQTNLVVRNIKDLIIKNLLRTGSKQIHLFLAGPAPLALFLGHRLDATAPVTCYGWVASGNYSQTCRLFSGSSVPGS